MAKLFNLQIKSRKQAEGLMYYFEQFILPEKPQDIAESLLLDLMVRIYRKIRNKVENMRSQSFNVYISPEEAKGYHLYWQNRAIEDGYFLERLIIEAQITAIDRVHG
jgi:hypothetical protein